MEEAAVDHVVEPLSPVLQLEGVFDQEGRLNASLRSLPHRPLDWHVEKVDSRDLAPSPGEEKGRVSGPATGIEDRAGDPVSHVHEGLLRLADVPGRLSGVHGLKGAAVGYWRHGRSPVLLSLGCLRHASPKCRYSLTVSRWLSYLEGRAMNHPGVRRKKVVRALQQRGGDDAQAVAAMTQAMLPAESRCRAEPLRNVRQGAGGRYAQGVT